MSRDASVQVPFRAEKGATARQASASERKARWKALGLTSRSGLMLVGFIW